MISCNYSMKHLYHSNFFKGSVKEREGNVLKYLNLQKKLGPLQSKQCFSTKEP